ncbi:MAG: flavodoxin-dependent (E)-4-hydroxy-3-methylbut-2-enyl-diphosphate synthase [Candidatus Moduliflexus flocculans]|nr:flavodoxin-dependent (E)-4-hydroxy-3-methylbut-2-enyl-diphosphate synthase [Candidatus Moduliflexus flocculans]
MAVMGCAVNGPSEAQATRTSASPAPATRP